MEINIDNSKDSFYRYKMPKIITKKERIKTVIINLSEISKSLNRDKEIIIKYFSYILGTKGSTKDNSLNGEFASLELQEILGKFISNYILCPKCKNPETVLENKNKILYFNCKACGSISQVLLKDKLYSFLIKTLSDKTSKILLKTDISMFEEKEIESTLKDWSSIDTKDLNSDLDKPIDERLEIFYSFLSKSLDLKINDIIKEVKRLDIENKAIVVLCEYYLSNPMTIFKDLETNRNLFFWFTDRNKKVQKYFLRSLELLIERFPELLSKVSIILRTIYYLDIVDEETFFEWKIKDKEIKSKAFPFLKWLKEAEEDSSEEESLDIIFSKEIIKNSKEEFDDFNIDDI